MKLRGKLLLIAIVPLVASLALSLFVLRQEASKLTRRQQELVRAAYEESTQTELRHYVALALSTVSPYYNTGRDDAEIKRFAMAQLADLDYGPDGYFFVYDFDGTVLMHSRQPELIGRNLMGMRDSAGLPAVHLLIERAKAGGGFVRYMWLKPSSRKDAPKLAYVSPLERWRWMVGTGIYTDDLEVVTQQLDQQIVSSIDSTMRWVLLASLGAVGIIFTGIAGMGIGELRAADAKLTLLARRVVGSQEEERAWLSRELHDGTSQTLVSAKLLTESALEHLPEEEVGLRPLLVRALGRINDALHGVRGISHRLRPAELDTLGLTTALRQLGQEMCEPTRTKFEFDACEEPAELPDEIRTTFFRVGQEALTNVQKHAGATQVRMDMTAAAGGLQLSIEDDGRGFDSEAMLRNPRRGIGLSNMRERLGAIGGSFTIVSSAQGTRVIAEVPPEVIARFASPA